MTVRRSSFSLSLPLLLSVLCACGQEAGPAGAPPEVATSAESESPPGSTAAGTIGSLVASDQATWPAGASSGRMHLGGREVEGTEPARADEQAAASSSRDPSTRVPNDWVTYRHPLGVTFRHPPSWRIDASPDGLVLVPPDLRADREWIVATGEEAGGVTDPRDPRVARVLDAVIRHQMPGLRRGEAPALDGRVARYDYAGIAPDGRRARCRILASVVGRYVVGFTLIADEERFALRADALAQIAQTTEAGSATGGSGEARPASALADRARVTDDARLIGVFGGDAYAGGADMGVHINTRLVWALNADGTFVYGAQSAMSASARDAAGNLRWTATGGTGGSVRSGRWQARSGIVAFTWSDGQMSRFRYGFEPDGTLAVRHPVSGKLLDIYSRIR
jgi:hypothetical protein